MTDKEILEYKFYDNVANNMRIIFDKISRILYCYT